MIPRVVFQGVTCTVTIGSYLDGRPSIMLYCKGEPYAALTVDLPDRPAATGEVFIRDYGAYGGKGGALESLEAAGIVKRTGRVEQSGYVSVPSATLLVGEFAKVQAEGMEV